MKRRGWAVFLAAALLMGTAGCGAPQGDPTGSAQTGVESEIAGAESAQAGTESAQTGTESENDGEESASAQADALPLPTSYLTPEEYAKADLWDSGNDERVAKVMRKAASGEAVTIACIGGSITEGVISSGSLDGEIDDRLCYADRFFGWWSERFPETEFVFINAGIGGTDSYLGVHRAKRDVLSKHPDLVLVEYAVNDGGDNAHKRSYENLVRNLLQAEGHPAVMLLFMGQTNGTNAQTNQVLIGHKYEVPMLSYANVIAEQMSSGRFTEKQLAGDGVHPSVLGHAITGEILWTYLNDVYALKDSFGESGTLLPEPITTEDYAQADLLDSLDLEPDDPGDFVPDSSSSYFPNGWKCDGGEKGIVFTAEFAHLGILYLGMATGGVYDVYVDGELVRTLNAYNSTTGWSPILGTEVYRSDAPAVHTVEIRKNTESEGQLFKLLGLLVS
ncbi:MAG: hypothetical protein K6E81_10970 [Lachnospiraceae bacterium]|nr:hypothetical protein [Lachnospiraceae bacterium]